VPQTATVEGGSLSDQPSVEVGAAITQEQLVDATVCHWANGSRLLPYVLLKPGHCLLGFFILSFWGFQNSRGVRGFYVKTKKFGTRFFQRDLVNRRNF
jgi:hypothetical protein